MAQIAKVDDINNTNLYKLKPQLLLILVLKIKIIHGKIKEISCQKRNYFKVGAQIMITKNDMDENNKDWFGPWDVGKLYFVKRSN